MKIVSLGLKYQSKKAYNYLRNIFCLPSVSTLEKLVNSSVQLEPGLCQPILTALGRKVANMTDLEKNAVLCFDEMSIKSSLSYNTKNDAVDGFENLGDFGENKKEYASMAMVIEVHGVYSKWKQPLGYLLSNGPCSADVLRNCALHALDELRKIGLNVRAMISDLGTCNQSMFRTIMNITAEKPYFRHHGKKSM